MITLALHCFDLVPEFTFHIATGDLSTSHHVLVNLTWEGLNGWGEAVPVPFYGETRQTTIGFIESIQDHPWWQAHQPSDIQSFRAWIDAYPGHMAAKSALEMALWDLHGQRCGVPLWQMWGLDARQPLYSAYTIGIDTLPEMIRKTEVALERGYRILKLKLGTDIETDTAILEQLRQIVPDAIPFWVDVNTGWDFTMFRTLLPVMMDTGVALMEEPFQPNVGRDHRLEAKHLCPFPIIADESVHHAQDIPKVADLVDGVNLKLSKCGGLSKARAMVEVARAHHLELMLGGFVETSLAVTAMAHLAPLADYLDLDAALLSGNDPAVGITWQGNQLMLPTSPGLGVTLTL